MKQNKNEIMFFNKHNTMIRSKYNLNVVELRLYLFILYSLQAEVEVYKRSENIKIYEDYVSFSIPRSNFSEAVTDKQYTKMSKLENVFEGLRQKPIYYEIEKENKKKDWSVFGFILKYSYMSENDTYVFTIDRVIYDMVIKYKSFGYTPLNLALIFSLKGVYAYRLYELLRLWSNTKRVINYTIDELKEFFMLNNKKSYSTYANFKNKVILPAIKELNEVGLFEIDIEENKIGKKVDSIDFKILDLDKRVYFSNQEDIKEKIIENIDKKGELNLDENKKENETKDFYIPNKKLFTAKTLESFTNDFKDYDFTDKKLKQLLQESILVALEKDDEEKIKVKSYNYFKSTLINKINDSNKVDSNVTAPKVKTRFHNITERYKNYEPDVLERMLKGNYEDKRQRDEFIRQEKEKQEQKNKLIRQFAIERIQNRTPLQVKDDKIWKDIIDEEVEKVKFELENRDLMIEDMNLEKYIHIS